MAKVVYYFPYGETLDTILKQLVSRYDCYASLETVEMGFTKVTVTCHPADAHTVTQYFEHGLRWEGFDPDEDQGQKASRKASFSVGA